MALSNFSLPFGGLVAPIQPWGVTLAPPLHPAHQLATNTNNLLYAPAEHQQQSTDELPPPVGSDYYKNNPYAHPQLHQSHQPSQQPQQHKQVFQFGTQIHNNNNNGNGRRKGGNTYLPPIPPPGARNSQHFQHHQQQQQQQHQFNQQQQQRNSYSTNVNNELYKTATGSTSSSSSSSSSSSAAAASASSLLSSTTATQVRTYGEGTYSHYTTADSNDAVIQPQQQQQQQYYNKFNDGSSLLSNTRTNTYSNTQQQQQQQQQRRPATTYGASPTSSIASSDNNNSQNINNADSNKNKKNTNINENEGESDVAEDGSFPIRPPGFTRVQAGQGSRTQVHAVLDYDVEEGEEDDYYDAEDHGEQVNGDGTNRSAMPTVTPIQGPIFLKNGTVPVVPLFSYPSISNGSFIQIPIWWTALSVALGLDVRGDVIKGVPCIKRFHQLFCPTAGNSYPIDKIEEFIDENKALMRRMYGDFEMNLDNGGPRQQTKKRKRRFIDEPDLFMPPGAFPAVNPHDDQYVQPHAEEAGESYFGKLRTKRQAATNQNRNRKDPKSNNINNNKGATDPNGAGTSSTGRLDACESKVEIVTPYWASNSAGKIRAIVNTQHFEQAIHQEICSKTQTARCEGDCGCEQKYKWHRLLAYDPDNDCKGIFMDWFLFPSCCVCRCNP